MYRRLVLLVSLIIPGFSSCSFDAITGKGPLVSRRMVISGFTAIEAGYAFRVNIRQGREFRVIVKVKKNILPYLVVRRSGKTLRLSLKSGNNYRNTGCEADITLPVLENLTLTGASRAILDRFSTLTVFSLDLSGASRLDGVLRAQTVAIDLSGASRLKAFLKATITKLDLSGASSAALQGECSGLSIDLSGASRVHGEGLLTEVVDAKLSGASRAWVHVSKRLNAQLSGASRLSYKGKGNPDRVRKSGASRIERRD